MHRYSLQCSKKQYKEHTSRYTWIREFLRKTTRIFTEQTDTHETDQTIQGQGKAEPQGMTPIVKNAIEQYGNYGIAHIWQEQATERGAHDGVMPKEGMDNSIQANGRNYPYPVVRHPHKGQQDINDKLCKKALAQLVRKHK